MSQDAQLTWHEASVLGHSDKPNWSSLCTNSWRIEDSAERDSIQSKATVRRKCVRSKGCIIGASSVVMSSHFAIHAKLAYPRVALKINLHWPFLSLLLSPSLSIYSDHSRRWIHSRWRLEKLHWKGKSIEGAIFRQAVFCHMQQTIGDSTFLTFPGPSTLFHNQVCRLSHYHLWIMFKKYTTVLMFTDRLTNSFL